MPRSSDTPELQPLVLSGPARGEGNLKVTAALVLIALSWVTPFLQPFHAPPLPAFYSEWLAIALSMAALICLLCDRGSVSLHWHGPVSLTLVGMAVLILLQLLAGMVPYPGIALTAALYLVWAILLMSAASLLSVRVGCKRTVGVLAVAVCIAGIASAGVAFAQFLHVSSYYSVLIYPAPDGIHYGNIGQRNHLAHFLALAVASVVYLDATRRTGVVTSLLCLALLTLAAALTASRSFWIYVAGFLVLALLHIHGRPGDFVARRVVFLCLSTIFLLVGWNLLLPFLDADGLLQTAVQRIIPALEHRPTLWREAVDMFLSHPFVGVGYGRFGVEHFAMQASGAPVVGLSTHAHNIVLHLAAECGIAGVFIILAFAIAVIWRPRWQADGLERWWLLSILLIVAAHSMVEYPLWYAYFLGIAAIVLGLLLKPRSGVPITRTIRAVLVLAFCGSLANMMWTAVSYARLERVLTIVGLYSDQAYDTFLDGLRDPVLKPHAEWAVASVMPVNTADLTYKIRLNDHVMGFMPSDAIAYQRAYLLALSGKRDEALLRLREAMTAYPDERVVEMRRLIYLARSHPLPFLPLLEFLRQDARSSPPR